jgi:hypothetical protein
MDRDEALATIDAARAAGEHIADDVYQIAYAPEAPAPPVPPVAQAAPSALTPAGAKAQIPAILDQLYKVTPGSPEYVALDQRRNDLYKAAYAEPTSPTPSVNEFAALTPSERTARIGAIRDLMGQYNPGSFEHQCLQDDLDACYQAAETAPGDSTSKPINLYVSAELLEQHGLHVDETARAENGAVADRVFGAEAPRFREELDAWLRTGAAQMADARSRMDPADVDALLDKWSGGKRDEWAKALEPWLAELSPRVRESTTRALDYMILSDTPGFIEWANVWAAKLRAGGK